MTTRKQPAERQRRYRERVRKNRIVVQLEVDRTTVSRAFVAMGISTHRELSPDEFRDGLERLIRILCGNR